MNHKYVLHFIREKKLKLREREIKVSEYKR